MRTSTDRCERWFPPVTISSGRKCPKKNCPMRRSVPSNFESNTTKYDKISRVTCNMHNLLWIQQENIISCVNSLLFCFDMKNGWPWHFAYSTRQKSFHDDYIQYMYTMKTAPVSIYMKCLIFIVFFQLNIAVTRRLSILRCFRLSLVDYMSQLVSMTCICL